VRCPFCGGNDTRVVDSRLVGEGHQVRRRRQCSDCTERFTTYEKAELSLPWVLKRDGTRAPFKEENLRSGMLRALETTTGTQLTAVERNAVVQPIDELTVVNSGLEEAMVVAYHTIRDRRARIDGVDDLRTAAFLVAIDRVATAYLEMGIFP